MGNIATDFAQQIEKLASRGMKFDLKEDKIKEHLLDIGYYRLGFYWCPFTDKDHNFIRKSKLLFMGNRKGRFRRRKP